MKIQNIREHQHFFEVLQTAKASQTAIMVLRPGQESGEKGNEHPKSEQVLFVVDGTVEAEINDERATLQSGDVVIVPAKAAHRFWNDSDAAAVTFNVYTPPAY
jgi:mannose-6-phosphate isomerase-like protein (cupin superfamily)